MLGMAVVALQAQESMFQAIEFKAGFEFVLYIKRQNRALPYKPGRELRIVAFNDPVKQVVFGPVALITVRASFHVAVSCRSTGKYEQHPCETMVCTVQRPPAG